MTKIRFLLLLGILTTLLLSGCSESVSDLASFPLEKALTNGKPTLAEFGWRDCIPCKSMKPILEELAVEYKDRVNVLIVEIPLNPELADRYAVKVMPVQIFFDSGGKEVTRHAGFLPKEEILVQFKKMSIAK